MDRNIPKFASFRPKPKESSAPVKRYQQPEVRTRLEKTSSKRPREDREVSVAEDSHSKLYYIDRRGDPDIVRYGTSNWYEVPAYRRSGYGHVLGLPLHEKIDRELSTHKEIIITSSLDHRPERPLKRKHISRERSRTLRFIHRKDVEQDDINSDFIALSVNGTRNRGSEEYEVDYRGLRDSDADKPSDPDVEYEFETIVDPIDAKIIARNSELVHKTREEPRNVQAWLDLIEHQEAMAKIGRSSIKRPHLADIRVSICEQALKKIGSDEDSQIKLNAAMMTEAVHLWNERPIVRMWTDILDKFPQSTDLWTQLLNFVQSHTYTFKYESCKETFIKCMRKLPVSSKGVDDGFSLYILVRLTSMIHQSGYQELALAIWQAILEFHLFKPSAADAASLEVMEQLKDFWDAEMPRIGEPDAKGWCHTSVYDIPSTASRAPGLFQRVAVNGDIENFAQQEEDSVSKLRYPGRTTEEYVDEDDPFHLILFSDIEEFVRILPEATPKTAVLASFLRFCQLPPLMVYDGLDERYILDPILHYNVMETSSRHGNADSFRHLVQKYGNCPLKRFQVTTELFFDSCFPEKSVIVDINFVRRVLKLLVNKTNYEESVGEYLLALESKYFPNEACKTAKRLLEARRTSYCLWNAYGLVESCRGNSAKADQVFSAALSMQKEDAPLTSAGSLELFYNWVWHSLHNGDQRTALWRLVSPLGKTMEIPTGSDEGPDSADLLRARRCFSDTSERALLNKDFYSATTCTSLLAFLSYLSSEKNPENAMGVFDRMSGWFSSHNLSQSPAAERHAQYIAQFLTYHAIHAPIVKPSLLRVSLEPLIVQFPNNTILLSIYAANESRFSIDDRVRKVLYEKVLTNEKNLSIIGWTFALHYEMLRSEIAGTTYSIRALWNRAEDDVAAHCPALWKKHVLFELEAARKQLNLARKGRRADNVIKESRERVRETFLKGFTQLPWCKEYIMMGFTLLGTEFLSEDELRQLYHAMVNREMRLYMELGDKVIPH